MPARPAPRHAAPSFATSALRVFFYLVMLAVAGVGQATGLINLLNWPTLLAVPVVGVFELFAVVILHEADERRRIGERASGLLILAFCVAGFVLTLQALGHWDRPVFAFMFCGASGSAFAYYVIRMENRRRDRQYAESGEDPVADPRFGWRRWRTDPGLCREARHIFRTTKHPDRKSPLGWRRLTAEECLERARLARLTRERQAHLLRLAKTEMAAVYGDALTDLMMTTIDPDEAARHLADLIDVRAQMAVFARRADPALLDNAMARDQRERHRERVETAQRDRSDERSPDRPSARGERSVSARSERSSERPAARPSARTERSPDRSVSARADRSVSGDGWWTTARDAWYRDDFAPELATQGKLIGGERLAAGLGLSGSAARRERTRLIERFADEVVSGALTPHAPLPDEVAQAITARSAEHAPTGELERLVSGER